MPVEAVATTATAVARYFAKMEQMGDWSYDLPGPSLLVLIGGLHAASARARPLCRDRWAEEPESSRRPCSRLMSRARGQGPRRPFRDRENKQHGPASARTS